MTARRAPAQPDVAIELLESVGVRTWLCGGWAEERRGLIPPRPHTDVDLLYPAPTFDVLDRSLQSGTLHEIAAKRFHHKRAFDLLGTMVEVVLLEPAGAGHVTNFWNVLRFEWPHDTLSDIDGSRVASPSALNQYRQWHDHVDAVRKQILETEGRS